MCKIQTVFNSEAEREAYLNGYELAKKMFKRPHGEIIDAHPFGTCSECGELLDSREYYREHRFCPKCGADMRVKEGESE